MQTTSNNGRSRSSLTKPEQRRLKRLNTELKQAEEIERRELTVMHEQLKHLIARHPGMIDDFELESSTILWRHDDLEHRVLGIPYPSRRPVRRPLVRSDNWDGETSGPLTDFPHCHHFYELYGLTQQVPWEQLVKANSITVLTTTTVQKKLRIINPLDMDHLNGVLKELERWAMDAQVAVVDPLRQRQAGDSKPSQISTHITLDFFYKEGSLFHKQEGGGMDRLVKCRIEDLQQKPAEPTKPHLEHCWPNSFPCPLFVKLMEQLVLGSMAPQLELSRFTTVDCVWCDVITTANIDWRW
jgi:hypothetical protein